MNAPRDWDRFAGATRWAIEIHAPQERKGSGVPYIAHPLAVAALVLEDGGDEDEAIAALLHDAIEDQDVAPDDIERRFGPRVRRIVEACTDTLPGRPRGPGTWRPRKEAYVEHVRRARPDELRVSLADKLHNSRSILLDHRRHGDGLFDRFSGGKTGTLWYYRALVSAFREAGVRSPLLDELDRVVTEIESLAAT